MTHSGEWHALPQLTHVEQGCKITYSSTSKIRVVVEVQLIIIYTAFCSLKEVGGPDLKSTQIDKKAANDFGGLWIRPYIIVIYLFKNIANVYNC